MNGVGEVSCLSEDAIIRLPFTPKNAMPAGKLQDLRGRPPLQIIIKSYYSANAKIVVMPLGIQFIWNDHLLFLLRLQPTAKVLPVRCGVETWAGRERGIGADRFRPL